MSEVEISQYMTAMQAVLVLSVLQIRRDNRNNLRIIIHISPLKHSGLPRNFITGDNVPVLMKCGDI